MELVHQFFGSRALRACLVMSVAENADLELGSVMAPQHPHQKRKAGVFVNISAEIPDTQTIPTHGRARRSGSGDVAGLRSGPGPRPLLLSARMVLHRQHRKRRNRLGGHPQLWDQRLYIGPSAPVAGMLHLVEHGALRFLHIRP